MTEGELAAIERAATDPPEFKTPEQRKRIFADTVRLVAEVRRLRAAIDEAIGSAVAHDHHRVKGTDYYKEFYAILTVAMGYVPEGEAEGDE